MTDGFLIVDKSRGMSSTQAVNRVKKATHAKKAGHAGTLDPMATGALVVALGKVTRLIRFIQDHPKEYLATARFGVATDSLDADGTVISREPMNFDPAELRAVMLRFIGTIYQVPPMISALRHEGRRLHELAREGTLVEREARPVEVHELELVTIGPGPYPEVSFRVVCGKGTYVRSLANDMAAVLGGSAHLTALRRARVGSLTLDRAISTDDMSGWEEKLLGPAVALSDLDSVEVDEGTAAVVRHGAPLAASGLIDSPEGEPVMVLGPDRRLVAVYARHGEMAKAEVVLAR